MKERAQEEERGRMKAKGLGASYKGRDNRDRTMGIRVREKWAWIQTGICLKAEGNRERTMGQWDIENG